MLRPRHILRGAATLGLLVLLGSSGGCDGRPDPPNLVLITIDTIRADHLGCYGYFRDTTPVLDALAEESILFENCFAPIATTLPSHLTLLTGTSPLEHGVLGNSCADPPCFRSNEGFQSIAELLQEEGYATAAFVSATPLKRWSGLAAGFATFDQPEDAHRRAEETNARFFAWLETQPPTPYFVWLHYYDPHHDYEPPAPYDTLYADDEGLAKYMESRKFWHLPMNFHPGSEKLLATTAHNLYDGEIRYLDTQIGKVLDGLRDYENSWQRTVFVVTGDHGEGLGQRGYPHHGAIWQEHLRVPLLIRTPQPEPSRIEAPVTLADVVPMLHGLCELPGAEAFLAQASGWDRLGDVQADTTIIARSGREVESDPGTKYMIYDGRWKYVRDLGGDDYVYDLSTDEFEKEKIPTSQCPEAAELRDRLLASIDARIARHAVLVSGERDSTVSMDARMQKELKALGY